MEGKNLRGVITAVVAAALLVVALVERNNSSIHVPVNEMEHLLRDDAHRLLSPPEEAMTEPERLAALTEKLTTPREFSMAELSADGTTQQLEHRQFLHLHHMKTGGTSMDIYLRCAMERLKKDQNYTIPYGSIHECNKLSYDRCTSGNDSRCQQRLANAAMMSYCAPLKDLPKFSWSALENGVNVTTPPSHGAITVLRHPVDRVWSMFRFQTKACFKCMNLTDIYEMMDAGDLSQLEPTCYQQLQNHQAANLLSTEWLEQNILSSDNSTDAGEDENFDAKLAEAIENMKSFFTVIGLTEHLETTIEIAGQVFPWMKPQVAWSDKKCDLAHANSSPRNNGCGEGHTHWDLPAHPDEETRAAIEAHNQLDLKLYAAAVQHFELQKRAVGFDEEQG
jgi:hypothetical protein